MHATVAETLALAKKAGISQTAIAKALGVPDSHLSGFKNGRPCSVEKHAQIAYAAGLVTRARLILLESVLEASRKSMPDDEELRTQLEAIINGLPEDEPTITAAPQSRGATARGVVADKPRLRKSLRT